MEINKIYEGDALAVLKTFSDNCVDCCITSPPYFGLRDYGNDRQIGLEETPELFVQSLVGVFTEVKRVLKPEGTLWLNIGDSYSGSGKGGNHDMFTGRQMNYPKGQKTGLNPKNLIGIPWMVAFALRSSGWTLRQDIIWSKPNAMPEAVTDRCTKSHEYIFLLSKSHNYYCDMAAIKEKSISKDSNIRDRDNQKLNNTPGRTKMNGLKHNGYETANKRSVWTVNTKPYKESHFATFPEKLITDMILAGCPKEGIILDPFMGAGTTAIVAKKLGRNYVGIELNPEYIKLSEKRLYKEIGMFL